MTTATGLFALSPVHNDVVRFDGTNWIRIGNSARELFSCPGANGSTICATDPNNGNAFRWQNNGWQNISLGLFAQFVTAGTNIYRLRADRTAVEMFNEVTQTWTRVGSDATRLFGYEGSVFLYTTDLLGRVLRMGPSLRWEIIGGAGRMFLAHSAGLYAITPDGQAVMSFDGTSWRQIGGPAGWLYLANGKLHATNPNDGRISRYESFNNVWTDIGRP